MIVHQKNKQKRILSSFTHPLVTLNLYQFLTLVEHKEDILKNACYQRVDSSHWIPQNRKKHYGSQWLLSSFWLISFIFGWTMPLNPVCESLCVFKRRGDGEKGRDGAKYVNFLSACV